MKAKLKKKFQKLLNVVMVVGILVTSFPISPLIQNVHAMSTVSGDKIIEVAQTYKSYTYGGVGTCTGLVTRVLNKLGIGQSIVGTHPYDIDKPQSGGGSKYAPSAMYRNAMNHPEDAKLIFQGYVKDLIKRPEILKNGDLALQRPEDKSNPNGSGHAGFIHLYGNSVAWFGANGDALGVGDMVLVADKTTGGGHKDISGEDFITVFRLTKSEPQYAKLTSTRTANENVEITFTKTDSETGKPLQGVEVDFYRDDVKFSSGISDASGVARSTSIQTFSATSGEKEYCTNYDDLDEEGRQAVASKGAYKNLVEAQSAADSEAQLKANELASQTHHFSVVETKAKVKYWLNNDNKTVSDSITGSGTLNLSLTNERVTGSAILVKEDKELKRPQNEAEIDGALYGLYARENILDPADASIIYHAGDEITRVRIKDSTARVDNLYLGGYFWQEITSSTGYSLNPNKENFDLKYADQTVKTVTSKSTSKEAVYVGDFEIEKIITSGEESEIVQKEQGAEFIAVAKKYVDKYGTIEEAWKHRDEYSEKEYDYLVTDENGYAKSRPMAYGKVVVKQTKGQIDTDKVKDEWIFTVSKENQDTIKYIMNNRLFTSYVKLVKRDSLTGKLIVASNTTFKIKNKDTKEYLTQKVGDKTYTEWKTNDKGEITLPLEVRAGNWLLEEVSSPDNYVINKEPLEFRVTNTNIIETDKDGDPITIVTMNDTPVQGRIKVEKKGEVLTGIKKDKDNNIRFIYEEKYLEGMTALIQADEDILDPADNSILYKKGEIVDVVTTSSEGSVLSKLLPLGKYLVYESESPSGMVLDSKKYEVSLEFQDNETEVVMETVSIVNERQKVEANLKKVDEQNHETALKDVVFILSATEDILSYDGEVLVKKGTLIERGITDSEGNYTFKADLPISFDDKTYFEIKEEKAKDGYYLSDEIITIDTKYKGQNIKKISNSQTITNKPIENYILVNKIDDKTLENIISKDFSFSLCKDQECNDIFAIYNADTEKGTALIPIRYGNVWYIKEYSSPKGYGLSSEVIKVELNETGLYVNDNKVEPNDDLVYSVSYQNTLLPVVQTGYEDNQTLYLITGGASLFAILTLGISLYKKKKRK